MLLKREHLQRIRDGAISAVFRRWKRPTVRAGGTLRTSVGVLAIDSVEEVSIDDISDADARGAGFASRRELVAELTKRREGRLYRIDLRFLGPDPRIQLRAQSALNEREIVELRRRLARLDAASRCGPWTTAVLKLIAKHPATRAAELAAILAWEPDRFKARVRKLKELGLTESLQPGYRLSPRGRAFLERADL